MTRRWPCIVLLGFVVSACAPGDWSRDPGYRSGGVYWWKPGFTSEAFWRDDGECRRESRSGTDSDEEDDYNRCMQARGYQVVPKGFVPPKEMHWRGNSVNLMHEEHRRCGELEGGVEGGRRWMVCECGAKISLPREAAHANRPT
jgi:hypothetical protein